jgi:hypothetical protein
VGVGNKVSLNVFVDVHAVELAATEFVCGNANTDEEKRKEKTIREQKTKTRDLNFCFFFVRKDGTY